jgi:hypothetical protein
MEGTEMPEEQTSVTTERQLPADPAKDTGGESEETTRSSQAQAETKETKTGKPAAVAEESEQFYDPKDLSPENLQQFKQMQRSFTKKMQSLKGDRSKLEAYDQFMRDPLSAVQRLAQQHGYQITKADAAAAAANANWEPKSWEDVISRAKSEAKQEAIREVYQQFAPYANEIKRTKQSHIVSVLDAEVPEWRQYEDEMIQAVQMHPTLANDPAMLARLAIPKEVQEGKAMQAALKRMEKKTTGARVSSGSSTSKSANGTKPNRPLSINEAVAFAKEKLARQGVRP